MGPFFSLSTHFYAFLPLFWKFSVLISPLYWDFDSGFIYLIIYYTFIWDPSSHHSIFCFLPSNPTTSFANAVTNFLAFSLWVALVSPFWLLCCTKFPVIPYITYSLCILMNSVFSNFFTPYCLFSCTMCIFYLEEQVPFGSGPNTQPVRHMRPYQ